MAQNVKGVDIDIVKELLRALSSGETAITYGELASRIKVRYGRRSPWTLALRYPLGRIQDYCIDSRVPCLSPIVMNQNHIPGAGFIEHYRKTHPEDTHTDEEIIAEEQRSCAECQDWKPLLERCGIDPNVTFGRSLEPLDFSILNWSVLADLLDCYSDSLESFRSEELYKWEAVAWFQRTWDLDAGDFSSMLAEAFSEAGNLLTGRIYYPLGMLEEFAKHDPESLRSAFRGLLDETKPLVERMERFTTDAESQLFALNVERERRGEEPAKNHFQDPHALSVYLAFANGEHHYLYKKDLYHRIAAILGADRPSNKFDKVAAYEKLCDTILDYLELRRPEIIAESDSLLNDSFKVADPNHHLLVQDIVYFAATRYARHWAYAPGEQAKHWEEFRDHGIIGIGWDALGDPSRFHAKKELKEALSQTFGTDNPTSSVDSIYSFVNDVKPGDIIWARKGLSQVIGRGLVTSEYRYDESRPYFRGVRDVEWDEINLTDLPHNFTQKTLYELTEKTAVTPSELEELTDRKPPKANRYWWLVASPKYWSLANAEIGKEQSYTVYTDSGTPRRIHSNFLAAKRGDIAIGYEATPRKEIVALCEITQDCDGENLVFRKIEDITPPIPYASIQSDPILLKSQFMQNPNGSFFALSNKEYERIQTLMHQEDARPDSYTDDDFLEDVFVSPDDLATMKRLLERKKNLILQGAPGTGKTYCAKRLAWTIMKAKDSERIDFVQFHQNTTYDDMMAGYRPTADGGFEAIPGEFLRFCDKAANDPDHQWFFIIDEINRANISKVFGEMLMLIESDHRDEPIRLPLLDREVRVPSNLYLIGMMNTADRGLALIDYALRRRFAFFDMKPAFGNERFRVLMSETGNDKLARLVHQVERLNDDLAKDPSFGPGFCIGHSYFCLGKTITDEEVSDILRFELEPLIKEYWFDSPETAESKIAALKSAL